MGGKLRSELYIDYGDEDANAVLFEELASLKKQVEGSYGGSLVWEDLPGRRARRIADYREGDVTNGDQHEEYIDWFFDAGARLREALDAANPPALLKKVRALSPKTD